jgi:hypothetical protein
VKSTNPAFLLVGDLPLDVQPGDNADDSVAVGISGRKRVELRAKPVDEVADLVLGNIIELSEGLDRTNRTTVAGVHIHLDTSEGEMVLHHGLRIRFSIATAICRRRLLRRCGHAPLSQQDNVGHLREGGNAVEASGTREDC